MKRLLILAGFSVLSACVTQVAEEENEGRVIYGIDDRSEYYTIKNRSQKRNATASAALIYKSELDEAGVSRTKSYSPKKNHDTLNKWFKGEYSVDLCSDQLFRDQPAISSCSGTYIGDGKVVTAGHCVKDEHGNSLISDLYVVFDYHYKRKGKPITKIKQAYEIQSILEWDDDWHNTAHDDYAVVLLKNKPRVQPAKYRTKGRIDDNAKLYVVGHPWGIPKKIAGHIDESVILDNSGTRKLYANLDTFQGNSGSGVFNMATNELEGILTDGKADVAFDTSSGCGEVNVCNSDGSGCKVKTSILGELVQRITTVPNLN